MEAFQRPSLILVFLVFPGEAIIVFALSHDCGGQGGVWDSNPLWLELGLLLAWLIWFALDLLSAIFSGQRIAVTILA